MDNALLYYAPKDEQGVVYLFSHFARNRFGLRVETVQSNYPDCIAFLNGKRIRIEFEYYSGNFERHKHNPKGCDWIVCWTHDWPEAPSHLRIIELRKEFGLGFNVWVQPVSDENRRKQISKTHKGWWSVPRSASVGDLVLYYRSHPNKFIQDIFCVSVPVERTQAGWKRGRDWMAEIRRVAILKRPLYLNELKENMVLKNSGFIRSRMRTRCKISDDWPELYRMILSRNPGLKVVLRDYGPERLA
ncbi:MAG: hypothetical protein L0196_11460 [candidate division Zixibacteria bacterium]|nr:hypothetical protein [candidate division Zixibacteria bacterium]